MRATAATALEQAPAEAGANPLTRRERRLRLGERPPARLAIEPSLAPQQPCDTPGDRQISNPHHRPVLYLQRPTPAPPTTSGFELELDLDLELLGALHDPGHGQPPDADQTANVILHPLFLLFRDFDNAKPARSSGCLYPGLNPARSTRPENSPPLPVENVPPLGRGWRRPGGWLTLARSC